MAAVRRRKIRVGHSPDADDAFMFYGIASGKVSTGPYDIVETVEEIERLNGRALKGQLDVTAISIHAYAYVADRYALLPCGASMGEGYGPEIVARRPLEPEQIKGLRIAVPGRTTSAYLAVRLFEPDFEPVEVPFDSVIEAVRNGTTDAGLLIHEGQLTFHRQGLHGVLNLGQWWRNGTGLPLPLGGNAVRRSLGDKVTGDLAAIIGNSIRYALSHRSEALEYSMKYARGIDAGTADRFVGMYVNERTLDWGSSGRAAVQRFLDLAFERGLIPTRVTARFAD